jgi:diguanylate cyclase (GGDEF)-like protein
LASWLHLQETQSRLRRAALTDPLTGAWNRRYFDRFLASAISTARAKRQHVNVLLFDIDNFKRYNDEFGHDAGDEILVEAVKLMRSVIRPTDRVCRIGGDEFAVIFHDPDGPRVKGSSDSLSTVELAHRFRRQILEHKFPKLGALARGTLTISGGMAAFPWDGSNAVDLLSRADELARASKSSGKNVITFGPGALRSDHDDVV